MPATRIHLVRHGEVHNPDGVLYGRLPQFALSESGQKMADAAAAELKRSGAKIAAIFTSPLLRTRESAESLKQVFKLEPVADERLIEPYNIFEGKRLTVGGLLLRPHLLLHLRNPAEPSWGEPYVAIRDRMFEALGEYAKKFEGQEIAVVTHQLPIWVAHLEIAGEKFAHNPSKRRCALSSITTVELDKKGKWSEASYRTPAAEMLATDRGAV
jgi:broad specificity phosphatase PhoE